MVMTLLSYPIKLPLSSLYIMITVSKFNAHDNTPINIGITKKIMIGPSQSQIDWRVNVGDMSQFS